MSDYDYKEARNIRTYNIARESAVPRPKSAKDTTPAPGSIDFVIDPMVEKRREDKAADKVRQTTPFRLVFRSIEPADYNFVLNAWLMSFRESKRKLKNAEYFHGQQNLIAEIAQRRNLVIGCDGDTPEWIAGFCCGVPLTDGRLLVDYIYTKHAYRERGIARGMLHALGWSEGMEIVATHWCRVINEAAHRYNAGYNPYFNTIGFSDV